MVGSIVLASWLTHCVLVYSAWDLKAVQINEHRSLIQKFISSNEAMTPQQKPNIFVVRKLTTQLNPLE